MKKRHIRADTEARLAVCRVFARNHGIAAVSLAIAVSLTVAVGEAAELDNSRDVISFSSYPIERYEAVWKRSPFTLSSVEDDSSVGFASNLVLAGYLKIGSDEYITVLNKQSNETQFISKEANGQGISLASVEPNADPLKVTARIRKADETAVVKYDSAIINAPPKQAQPSPTAGPSSPTGPSSVDARQANAAASAAIDSGPARQPPVPQPERRVIIRRSVINPPQTKRP